MPPALLADLLLSLHAAIVAFVVLGQVAFMLGAWLGWEWTRAFWLRLAHLVTIGFVVVNTWLGDLCPLTIWEQDLRRAAGQPAHEGSFIGYWLDRVLYIEAPWWAFIVVYTAFALLVVVTWWRWPPRWPWRVATAVTPTTSRRR